MKIDFVIAWVDGNDAEWQKEYLRYRGVAQRKDACRFRDWGLLPYWFRAIEKYAPWVNKVFLLTNGQIPVWMNTEYEKLRIVRHEEYIPADMLPTFNSNTINLNLHRIPDLSEHFVYFDDDMFLNAEVEPERYFVDGLPCDYNAECVLRAPFYNEVWGYSNFLSDYCDIAVLNSHFDRREVITARPDLWNGEHLSKEDRMQSEFIGKDRFFHGFAPHHNEKPFLKSVFADAWEKEEKRLKATCTQFRIDYELGIYFMRYWQLASNKFHPIGERKDAIALNINKKSILMTMAILNNNNVKSLCINDNEGCSTKEFHKLAPELRKLMEEKFPEKSLFEK